MPKMNSDGNVILEMTAEEMAEIDQKYADHAAAMLSIEERYAALEADNAELKEKLDALIAAMRE